MNPAAVIPPPRLNERPRGARWRWLILTAALGGFAILSAFNPAESPFYPRCLFRSTTGLLCPGCGGLRATHQLLHGHIAAAWALNPLAVLLLPLLWWFGLSALLEPVRGRGLPMPALRPALIWLLFAVTL